MSKRKCRCCLLQLYGHLQPSNAEPLAIETLAGALRGAADVTLHVLGPFQSDTEQQALLKTIAEEQYDLIGISCPQSTYDLALSVLRGLATSSPSTRIVMGHALPTAEPNLFLDPFPQVIIVRGWGELALSMICAQISAGALRLDQIPSLSYVDEHGRRHDNPVRWPAPAATPKRLAPTRYFARVEASRGCHYNVCTFCARPPANPGQPPWVRVPQDLVIRRVRQLVREGSATFTFADEDFVGNDPAGALALAEQLATIPGLDFALSVRADNIIAHESAPQAAMRARLFATLRRAGLSLVFVGVESFAPSQLRRFGKGATPQDSVAAIRVLEGLRLEIELGLILFDPLTTPGELATNLALLQSTGYWRYAGQLFSSLRPQVGTPYVSLLARQGLLGDLRPDPAEYGARYRSDTVSRIHDLCLAWNERFDAFYHALRNAVRSELGAGDHTAVVHEYRTAQLAFLDGLLHTPPEQLCAYSIASDRSYQSVLTLAERLRAGFSAGTASPSSTLLVRATHTLLSGNAL